MRKRSVGLLKVFGVLVLLGIAYAVSSCPSISLQHRFSGTPTSAPLDCFPDAVAGVAEGSEAPLATGREVASVDLPFDLSGTWALQEVTTTWASAPLIGDIETVMVNTVRLEVQQTSNRLTLTARVCGIENRSSSSTAVTIIPQSFIDAIEVAERHAVIEPVSDGYRYRQERYLRMLGVNLEHPDTDPIPSDEDDPRVYDDDGDGHPGVTVSVEGVVDGDVYLAQRHWKDLCGDVVSEDRIQGYIRWGTDQEVLDATSFILNRNPSTVIEPDWEANTFDMRRIDPSLTCADLVREREAIFEVPGTTVVDPTP